MPATRCYQASSLVPGHALRCPSSFEDMKMKTTPVAARTSQFKTKDKLVEAVKKLATDDLWLDRVNDEKGLERVSNRKLLRLHGILEDAKRRFGTRAKLITAILKHENRAKDVGLKGKLERYPLPRLVDFHDAAEKRAARAQEKLKAAKPKAKVKQSRSKKAKKKVRA